MEINKYNNGKIYKLVCNITGEVYYGSTIQNMSKRLGQHKDKYKSYINGRHHYVSSFDILKNNNYEMILVENYPCKTQKELLEREGHYMKNNQCVNKCIAGRTYEDWYDENKIDVCEKIRKYRCDNTDKLRKREYEYYHKNKKIINEKSKERYLKNKTERLEKDKIYREANKDEIIRKRKEYYEANKDEINRKKREKRLLNKAINT